MAKKVVHLNHAGASPALSRVMCCFSNHQSLEQQVGAYQAAFQVKDRLEKVYQKAAELIHATAPDGSEIALVESATVGWTRLFYAFCAAKDRQDDLEKRNGGKKKKVILISEAEYAANVVAACQWARSSHPVDSSWTVLAIPSKLNPNGKSTGKVDLAMFQTMLKGEYVCSDGSLLDPESIALVCITHIPTNSGIVNPAKEIGKLIAHFNQQHSAIIINDEPSKEIPCIFYLLDSCQSIGQMPVNAVEIQCHGLVATGRKYLRGPRGTGFLYIPEPLASTIIPHHVDHFGLPVRNVPLADQLGQPVENILDFAPLAGAKRFEFWESSIASRLALGEALQEVLELGMEAIQATILERVTLLFQELQKVRGIELYYEPECGICTFGQEGGKDPSLVKERLWNDNRIEVSIAPATSTPLDSARTRAPNLIRASVSYTTTKEEVLFFCERLASILNEK